MSRRREIPGDHATVQKAVIYSRVSTEEQTKNLSLDTQEKACLDYCRRYKYEVDRIFREEGVSAKTADRPELIKMLEYCHKNKNRIQYVVVYNLTRFSRNTRAHFSVREILLRNGVKLRSVYEQIDESSTGTFMETVFAGVAQLDNDQRSERTTAAMKAAIEKGRWTFKAPLGFINFKRKDGVATLIPDPERAQLVTKVFKLYSSGLYTKKQVLKMVTDLGLRTASGKLLSQQTLDRMLENPLYAGWMAVQGWGGKQRGNFDPLVTQELFDKVQAILRGKGRQITSYVRNNPDFPLRRFVQCGTCGRPITASWSTGRNKRYPYYRCPNYECNGINIRKETLESGFTAYLAQIQPNPHYMKLFTIVVSRSMPR